MSDEANVVAEQSQSQQEQLATVQPKKKRHRTNYGVTKEEFVTVWNSLGNTKAVADKLTELARSRGKLTAEQSVPKNVVAARLSMLRKSGVELKPTVRTKKAVPQQATTEAAQ
jgi:Zn-dependent oligopeptidase